jgi:NAD(P)-dependent dehydrogenase (short-subunit alcohol dehydrogenase family)
MLGEAGATVYCTGRSARGKPNMTGVFAGRPENIDDTADMVSARGGVGIAVRVDHLVESEVESLAARIRNDHGRVDILVNDISEGVLYDFKPFWKLPLEKGFLALRQGIHSHIITARHIVPLMIERRRAASSAGLIVEIGDGDTLDYRGNLFYDLVKISTSRLAFAMAQELRKHNVAAVAITPGYTRTESVLEHLGVTEANWRDAAKKDPNFLDSETPFFVGRAIAALAADPKVMSKSGGLLGSWTLAKEYGVTDVDGRSPDFGKHLQASRRSTPFQWTIASPSEK